MPLLKEKKKAISDSVEVSDTVEHREMVDGERVNSWIYHF